MYGYPPEAAARIAVEAGGAHDGRHVSRVRFVCFDTGTLEIYRRLLH